MKNSYVHGYNKKENSRLEDQAETLEHLLHNDTVYKKGSSVLEAGCGVGAQTISLVKNNPLCNITSIDISHESVLAAKEKIESAGYTNVVFKQADIFNLPFEKNSFDHIFICFVLEHLPEPVKALSVLKQFLKPGGTITLIEGDHGSAYFHPESHYADQVIQCQVKLQKQSGGNANIGRQLYPLLEQSEFSEIYVSPRMVYVDSSRPNLVEGFTKNTFTAMIEGIQDKAVENGLISAEEMNQGIKDLYRTADSDGVFCYTFFKANAVKSVNL